MGSTRNSRQYVGRTLLIALTVLLIGLFVSAIYIILTKMLACPPGGNTNLYCNIKGKSFIGVLFFVSLAALLVGVIATIGRKIFTK